MTLFITSIPSSMSFESNDYLHANAELCHRVLVALYQDIFNRFSTTTTTTTTTTTSMFSLMPVLIIWAFLACYESLSILFNLVAQFCSFSLSIIGQMFAMSRTLLNSQNINPLNGGAYSF